MNEIICSICKKDCAAEHTIYYKGEIANKYYCYPCSTTDPWKIFERTGDLTTSIIMDASLKCYKGSANDYPYGHPTDLQIQINASYERFKVWIKNFEREVWVDGGMRKTMMASSKSGMSCESDGIKLLTFCTGGRCMIDIHIGHEHMSVVTLDNAERDNCMGFQGIYGKEESLFKALDKVMTLWREGKLNLKDDVEVSIGF